MSVEVRKNPTSIYEVSERIDEMQIAGFDSELQDKYVKEINGSFTLLNAGINHGVFLYAENGNPLTLVLEKSKTYLNKDEDTTPDKTDHTKWIWDSMMVFKNEATGMETVGQAEMPAYKGNMRDEFAKRTAMTKAERNAKSKHMTEEFKTQMIRTIKATQPEKVHVVKTGSQTVKQDLLQDEKVCRGDERCKVAPKTLGGKCMECGGKKE